MSEEKRRFQKELEAFAHAASRVSKRIDELSCEKIMAEVQKKLQLEQPAETLQKQERSKSPTPFLSVKNEEKINEESDKKAKITSENHFSSQICPEPPSEPSPTEFVNTILAEIGIQSGEKIHFSKFPLIEDLLDLPSPIRRIKYNKQTQQYTILMK
ncbi:Oidioi.mRNA.OKI2018_I69.PAR.g9317.t1.cds [Oikopleura dioica]|uniref:Oidioi.mRNA.OKI2018_I69.PAR.g9317.t1.cds n=1 Tax=Oikopleura dioica TaxID=34765 RepID=A0ABN7RK31_OIKDI|nr:Oidioi.mRNA.OKI2018_I69.PAR.g9317.t1.cds [Oikopleura dioica]